MSSEGGIGSCQIGANHACFSREHIMPSLTIRHVTTYRYRRPVAFGEHRMMLRPRDSHDQRVIEASLEISPEPRSLRFVQDAFGNHVGIARFSARSQELCVESIVCLEHSPWTPPTSILDDAAGTFPADYRADEMPDLAHCIERHQADRGTRLAAGLVSSRSTSRSMTKIASGRPALR